LYSVEALQKFVEDIEEGSLEPYVKSEPIPENNDAGTKIAVTRNFDELVTNYDGDVLIGKI
jgi:protein disulfide-isomerase A3